MRLCRFWSALCLTFLLVLLLPIVTTGQTQLPPDARAAFDEGMAAVGQQQWTVAIRNFLKAQKAAPEAPEVLFNLGLAESKVPGLELRAMAWFQAYLLAVPSAPNGDAVRREITNLKVRVEGTLDKLISQAMRLASTESYPYPHYADIAVAQARLGDITTAKRTAAKAFNDKYTTLDVNNALSRIGVIQYYTGDTSGAEQTIHDIGRGGASERPYAHQAKAFSSIAFLQAMDGDFAKAEATIERAQSDGFKCRAYVFVAAKEALADQKDKASALLAKALAIPLTDSSTHLNEIREIQVYIGDSEGANKTNMKYIEDLKRNSFLSKTEIENADRRNRAELAEAEKRRSSLRGTIDYRTQSMAKAQLGSISHPDILRLKLEISGKQTKSQELLGLLNKQLNTELFLDPESAIRTIGGGKTPGQIFEGMMEAIEKTTDVLEYLKILGR